MYEPNVDRILQMLSPADVVLDVGGWACPFNRTNFVLDAEPYATRGFYRTFGGPAFQGGEHEVFTSATWLQRDLCERTPFPFADKAVDFVICSHTLEDLRDPLWVCSEIQRVGKRGYIEVPSRAAESSRGWEHPRLAGLSHHRWLIEIDGSHIRFLMKYHRLHSHWRLSLPASYLRRLDPARKVQWLFWTDRFSFEEITIHGLDRQEAELERFVRATSPYAPWRLRADRAWRTLSGEISRVSRGLARRILPRHTAAR